MVFSSITFLFLFLPSVLTVFYLLPNRYRNLFLLLASLFFYYWGENILVWLIITVIAINYGSAVLLDMVNKKNSPPDPLPASATLSHLYGKWVFVLCMVTNLSLLAWFKYSCFLIENWNALSDITGLKMLSVSFQGNPVLPLGISFFIFQAMSYTIDVYRGRVKASRSLTDFSCYVTLFPQLVAGPIVRYIDIEKQLKKRKVSAQMFSDGIFRFITGLGKKVLIANSVAEIADAVFAVPAGELSAGAAWLGVLCYTLQIYYDFSGYSDMAIGLGRMFGFSFLENFNYPYISQNIQEFWRRWHISLSTWFRDYLYIPLGGNRVSGLRTYVNLMTVFLLCGLWHGASWNYIFWGGFHGFFLIAERLGLSRFLTRQPQILRHSYTLIVVMTGWVFFRSENLTDAFRYLGAMAGFWGTGELGNYLLMFYGDRYYTAMIIIAVIFSAPLLPFFRSVRKRVKGSARLGLGVSECFATGFILLLCLFRLSSGAYNPFIYFKF